MNYFRCIGGNGGGGFVPPVSSWRGTPAEYTAIQNKTEETIYKTYYDNVLPSAEYIGRKQIFPTDKIANEYAFFVSYFNTPEMRNYYVDTQYQWLNNDFELQFSLPQSSYTGTQVLIANSTNQNFNIILSGTNLKLFDTAHNQTIIDKIVPNAIYTIRKEGTTITILRDSTELISYRLGYTGDDTLRLLSWNNSYSLHGAINFLTIKTL